MTHVDIVKNEWLAGYQVVIGRLWVDRGQLHVDAKEPTVADLIDRYKEESTAGTPEEFVASLHDTLHGDYLFATQPHDEERCEYHAMVVPLKADDPRTAVGA